MREVVRPATCSRLLGKATATWSSAPDRLHVFDTSASAPASASASASAASAAAIDHLHAKQVKAMEVDAKVASYSPPATPPPASTQGSSQREKRLSATSLVHEAETAAATEADTGAAVAFEENKLMGLSMRGRIARAAQRDDYETAVATWDDALARQIDLDQQSHVHMLAACTALPSSPRSRKVSKAQQHERSAKAKEVFTKLLESGQTPSPDALNLVGKACAVTGDRVYAFQVAEEMVGMGVQLTSNFRSSLITACARSRQGSQQQQMAHASGEYHKLKRDNLTGTSIMYNALVNMYNTNSKPHESTAVLQDMITAGYQPSLRLVMSVLTVAIDRIDTVSLRLLTSWCIDLNGGLDRGSCQAILNVAARKGDTRLATRIWTIMENAGYSPTQSAYAAIVHAFGTEKDDLSMFGALLEMEQRGYKPSQQLIRTVAGHLSLALSRTDDAYFLLSDMHARCREQSTDEQVARRGDESDGSSHDGALKVTTSALNAVLEACARLHQLDRTFATFDDMCRVFDLVPDLMSYNALLIACAQPRAPQADAALRVLEDLREAGLEPDSESYKFILLSLARCGEHDQVDEILERMSYSGTAPSSDALEELCQEGIRNGSLDRAAAMAEALRNNGHSIPSYLIHRLRREGVQL